MKLEVGMYCYDNDRKKGIGKILLIGTNNNVIIDYKNERNKVSSGNVEASYNIIELINKNDILLGRDGKIYQCWKIYKDYVFTYSKNKQGKIITLVDYQIDKILTREQFEKESYKIGEKR